MTEPNPKQSEESGQEPGGQPDDGLGGWSDHGFPGGFLGIAALIAVAFAAGYLAYWVAGLLMYR